MTKPTYFMIMKFKLNLYWQSRVQKLNEMNQSFTIVYEQITVQLSTHFIEIRDLLN